MKKYRITEYDILSDKFSYGFEKRIVILSDFHNNEYGIDINRLYQDIDIINPGCIFFAGDICEGEVGNPNKKAFELINKLSEKYKIYYGLGNHEYRMKLDREKYNNIYERLIEATENDNIELLDNKSIDIGDNIWVHGVSIERNYYKKLIRKNMPKGYINSLIQDCNQDKYNILIAHNPIYFDEYVNWGADLVFSGHMHGGMARIPFLGGVISPDYIPFPKYDKGIYKKHNTTMILSAGIGTHTINIRPFNPPEIVVVKLLHK